MTSRKDQSQYWADKSKPYVYLSVPQIAEAFKNSKFGRSVESELSDPFDKSSSHPAALSKSKYAVTRWELCKACFSREMLLISRHRFLYIFRTCQVCFTLLLLSFFLVYKLLIRNIIASLHAKSYVCWNLRCFVPTGT